MSTEKEAEKTKQAHIVAEKITPIFQFVGMLSQEDVDMLEEMSKNLEEHTSKLRAVQGVMVDYDRAEHKMKWNKQAQDRIKGLLLIRNAMTNTPDEIDAREANADKEAIAKMFGL